MSIIRLYDFNRDRSGIYSNSWLILISPDGRSWLLQWISTGAIMCAEGGGHHRPNRHAELAREIFRSLELVIADKSADPLDQLVARRMHPKCVKPCFATTSDYEI